jgi:hypothetical protein
VTGVVTRECDRCGKETKDYTIFVENLKRKVLFKDFGVNWRIIYSRYLKKQEKRARDTPTSASFEHGNENSGSFDEFLR